MAGKAARKLALKMADAHLERVGITKAAGGLQREELAVQFLPTAVAVADLVAKFRKISRDAVRRLEENDRRIRALAEQAGVLGGQAGMLAGRHVPGAVDVERRFADLNAERFGVGLVEQQEPPKVNGHSTHGKGVSPSSPPPWHPESDD